MVWRLIDISSMQLTHAQFVHIGAHMQGILSEESL